MKYLQRLLALTLPLCLTVALLPSSSVADENNFRMRANHLEINENTEEDVDAEVRFGQSISARILGQFPLIGNQSLNTYVNLVGKSLAMHSSRDDIHFRFAILDTDFINAYSAPGGYVFITKGAIDAMQDEAELAAVLAHEIAHITEKHIVKEFKIKGKEKGATAGVSRLIGSSKGSAQAIFSKAVDNAVNKLFDEGFKQKDELSSDHVALLILANTGYDPTALARYLKRIKSTAYKPHDSNQKTTHPPTDKRIQTLKELTEQENLQALNFPKAKSRFETYVEK